MISPTAPSIPIPMGSIMAVAAVLLIHIDRNALIAPNASSNLPGVLPTERSDSMESANRLSRP